MFGTLAMFAALAMFGTIAMFCRPCHVLPPLRGFDGGFVFEGLTRLAIVLTPSGFLAG